MPVNESNTALLSRPRRRLRSGLRFREFNACHAPDSGQFCSDSKAGSKSGKQSKDIDGGDGLAHSTGHGNADAWLPLTGRDIGAEARSARRAEIKSVILAQATTDAEREHADAIAQAELENEILYEQFGLEGSMGVFRKNGEWTPERQALHRKIADEMLAQGEPSANPTAIFMGGVPASGKSTAAKGLSKVGKVLINSDDIKAMLPEYTGRNAAYLHAESAYLADSIFAAAVQQGKTVIYDGTMKTLGDKANGMLARMAYLKERGYRVEARFTDVSIDTSVSRAMTRFSKDGRYVPVGFIRAMGDGKGGSRARSTFEALRDQFDAYALVDNNGTAPNMVGSYGKLTEASRIFEPWSRRFRG